jgi:hypothetical protein
MMPSLRRTNAGSERVLRKAFTRVSKQGPASSTPGSAGGGATAGGLDRRVKLVPPLDFARALDGLMRARIGSFQTAVSCPICASELGRPSLGHRSIYMPIGTVMKNWSKYSVCPPLGTEPHKKLRREPVNSDI